MRHVEAGRCPIFASSQGHAKLRFGTAVIGRFSIVPKSVSARTEQDGFFDFRGIYPAKTLRFRAADRVLRFSKHERSRVHRTGFPHATKTFRPMRISRSSVDAISVHLICHCTQTTASALIDTRTTESTFPPWCRRPVFATVPCKRSDSLEEILHAVEQPRMPPIRDWSPCISFAVSTCGGSRLASPKSVRPLAGPLRQEGFLLCRVRLRV